jgi:hypothetical protein
MYVYIPAFGRHSNLPPSLCLSVHTHTQFCILVRIHTQLCTLVRIHTSVYLYAYTHSYVHLYAYTLLHTCAHTHTNIKYRSGLITLLSSTNGNLYASHHQLAHMFSTENSSCTISRYCMSACLSVCLSDILCMYTCMYIGGL